MRMITLPVPLLGFVIGTRAMLGVGAGLLLADRLPPVQRRRLGMALVAFGAATTIPAATWLARNARRPRRAARAGVSTDPRLVGTIRYARKGDEPC